MLDPNYKAVRLRKRMIELSDGVIAFAITLLVLNLVVPTLASGESLTEALGDQWPQAFAWVLSFVVIATQWYEHHQVVDELEAADGRVVAANFVFLGAITTLPFTTDLLGQLGSEPLSTALYAANIAVVIAALLATEYIADRHGLRIAGASRPGEVGDFVPLFFFLVSIPVAFVDPTAAKVIWTFGLLAWPLEWFLDRRQATRRLRPERSFAPGPTGELVPVDADTIGVVVDALRPERAALIELLSDLDHDRWELPTECPAYSVHGVAAHILGDDLSLLSRQRDGAQDGLTRLAADMPGADFRTLLDAFNDRWVAASGFVGPSVLVDLLRATGEWTEAFYRSVDPRSPGEPVGLFGPDGDRSPYWQAIAREYLERWVHHSQIRRALGLGSLDDEPFVRAGVAIVATIGGASGFAPERADAPWRIGEVELGDAAQAAAVLTRAHPTAALRELLTGPPDAIEHLALLAGRPAPTS